MPLTKPRAYQISNLDFKQSVRVVSLTNVTLDGSAPATVDGVTLSAGDRVLVAGQTDKTENGVYVVDVAGTGSSGTWERASDFDDSSEVSAGIVVMVTEGTLYDDTQWKLTTNDPITIGTTELEFARSGGNAFGDIDVDGTSLIAGSASDSFNIVSGNNVTISANVSTNTATFSVDGFGGEVTGNLIPDTNEAYDLGSSSFRFRDLYLSGNTIDLAGTTLSVTDGDIEITDSQNNRKSIIVDEIEIGSGTERVVLKRGSTGRPEFSAIDTDTGANSSVSFTAGDVGAVDITGDTMTGDLTIEGSIFANSKSFLIDHPTKKEKKLRYGSLESPYHGVRLTGEATLTGKVCHVELPDYIRGLCKQEGSQVQLTNIKHGKILWVDTVDVDNNYFVVSCERGVFDKTPYSFYWAFTAIRKDIEDMIVEVDQ